MVIDSRLISIYINLMSDYINKINSPALLQLRVRELVLLELIHEAGSLRGAAAALHVTQPAVTQALRHLEQAFGAVLVKRGTRGEHRTRLTPKGLAALHRLRVVSAEIQGAQRATSDAGEVQQLRLGALPFMAIDWVPGAVALLMKKFPRVRIEVVEATVSELWHRLADGKLDMVANYLLAPADLPDLPSDLVHRVIRRSKVVLVAPAKHPLFRKTSVSLGLLATQRWALPPPDAQAHTAFVEAFLKAGLRAPEPDVVAERHSTRLALAQRLNILTVVPEDALQWQGGVPKMKLLPCDFPSWGGNVVLAARKSSLETPAAKAFYDLKF
jgi:molybdate transport repressor ModE-like protein